MVDVTLMLVAAGFRWDEYPGLRVGRIYSGTGDVDRHPRGETHVVVGPDAVETACGLSRADFPYDFTEPVSLLAAQPCGSCQVATGAFG